MPKPKALPTLERLNELLTYNPETGAFFWRYRWDNVWDARWAGKPAGCVSSKGYLVLKIDNVRYQAHRVAWLMHHKVEPPDLLDHRDGDGANCRILNLRPATESQNSVNSAIYTKVSPLPRGVTLTNRGRFQARITSNGKQKSLGVYGTPEEAHQVYLAEHRKTTGDFARH